MGKLNFFFWNNRSNRTTDMRENVPPKLAFWPSISRYGGLWGKNFKAVFGNPFSIEEVIFIFVVRLPIPWKLAIPSQKKKNFSWLFWKILFSFFFLKKLLYEKYLKPHFLQKNFILLFVARHPLSLNNGSVLPQMVFHNFFYVKWRTSLRLCCSKVYSFKTKFYG